MSQMPENSDSEQGFEDKAIPYLIGILAVSVIVVGSLILLIIVQRNQPATANNEAIATEAITVEAEVGDITEDSTAEASEAEEATAATATTEPTATATAEATAEDEPEEDTANPEVAALVEEGMTAWYQQRFADAIAAFDSALSLDSDSVDAYLGRAFTYLLTRDYSLAKADLDEAFDLAPEDARVFYGLGRYYYRVEQYDRALAQFDHATDLDPDYAQPYFGRGSVYRVRGDYSTAIDEFTRSIELDPEFSWPYTERGLIYGDLGDINAEIDDYQAAVSLDPYNTPAVSNLAITYWGQGQVDSAMSVIYQGLDYVPSNANLQALACEYLYKSGDLEEALPYCDESVRLEADNIYGLSNRSEILLGLGDIAGAARDWAAYVRVGTPNGADYRHLCDLHLVLGQLNDARSACESAVDLNSNDPCNYNTLGLVVLRQGDAEEALSLFNTSIQIFPLVNVFYNRGLAHYLLGDEVSAQTDYDEFTRSSPTSLPYYSELDLSWYEQNQNAPVASGGTNCHT